MNKIPQGFSASLMQFVAFLFLILEKFPILGSNKAFLTDKNISEVFVAQKGMDFLFHWNNWKIKRLKIGISWKPKRNKWLVSSSAAQPFVVPAAAAAWIYLPASPPQTGCAPWGCLQSKRGTAPPSAGAGPTAWSWHRGGDTQPWPMERRNLRSSYWNWRKHTNRKRRERRLNQIIKKKQQLQLQLWALKVWKSFNHTFLNIFSNHLKTTFTRCCLENIITQI